MKVASKTSNGKWQIDKKSAFCKLLSGKLPSAGKRFGDLFAEFDSGIHKLHPFITTGALSNAHGDWYEWLLAISVWNYRINHNKPYLALLLPNIARFDVAELYESDLHHLVNDLRRKVEESASVKLITSNPDFVIIDLTHFKPLPLKFNNLISEINHKNLITLEEAYTDFKSKCKFDSIIGFISVKFTLRPDRRLQIPHEGSLMKALYTHLQTRQWIISPKGLKYYAVSSKVGNADISALKTVATHSITTVHSLPQAAVDELFTINSLKEAESVYQKVLC